MPLDDREVFTRLTNTVDSTLRQKHKKGLVDKAGSYPVVWSVRKIDDPSAG